MKEKTHINSFHCRQFLIVVTLFTVCVYLFHQHSNPKCQTIDISYIENQLSNLNQFDDSLRDYVRVRHLTPPSTKPYNLNSEKVSPDAFSGWVANFFNNKRDGIFIEAGANAGEDGSHTLYLEKELGWSGLLIECNPTVVPYLKSKHRNAWVADICISPTQFPDTLNFSNPTNWTYSGTLGGPLKLPVPTLWTFFDVQTIPLYTVIAALGWREIDYFSFDIEGQELAVLKNFPFDLVTFKVLIIEVLFYKEKQLAELDALLKDNGYIFVQNLQIDRIYAHNSVKELIKPKT